VKISLLFFSCSLFIISCSQPPRYGYTPEEWDGLTLQQQEDAIKTENNIETMRREEREKAFENKPLNTIFGTRSNTF